MEKYIEFIEDICDFLDVDVPLISFDTSDFPSDTTQAQYEAIGGTLYVNEKYIGTIDLYFIIAHELRHKWQFEKHRETYFKDYNNSRKSIESYNMQKAELDANAFAQIVLADYFQLEPQFNGLSENVKSAIKKRVIEILAEEKR